MREVTSLPHDVKEDEHLWIPVSDGTRLAARVWRPATSDEQPVPAVLEFIPYRKRDLTAVRDSVHHPYLAGHGYACARVDLRGTGESEGVLTDEYLEQELRDAEDVLAWLAGQPWCDGHTGMMGISWGGFNALQVAARRPPSLRAIAIASFTDDRYADDIHHMGGCLLSDNLSWASTMFAGTSCPPDPALVGEDWREMWLRRLRESGLWLRTWLAHQRRDDYWKHGSVCENYEDVGCPVFAVSGWADGYSNAVFRLMERLGVERKGLIGPWSHKYPHQGRPGPAIGYLQELVRWWDRWLKKIDNGVMDEPTLRVWMQQSVPPSTSYEQRPGRWVGEPSWPSPHTRPTELALAPHRLCRPGGPAPAADDETELTLESPLSVGQFAGKWCSYSAPPDLPYDQREEDGGSLVFDTGVLTEPCEILGAPVVRLELEASEPVAMIAARLSDVAADGKATRVTYGLLNLTHRDSHEHPEPLEPGRRYLVDVQLNGVAQVFPPGHRIRLSLSTSYWPLAWPPPRPARVAVFTGASRLVLPVRPMAESDEVSLRPFDEPEGTPPLSTTQVHPGRQEWRVSRDLVHNRSTLEVVADNGTVRFDGIDLEVTRRERQCYSSEADDPLSARGEVESTRRFRRGDWDVRTVTHTVLRCSEDAFLLHARLDAYEGEQRIHSANWDETIPRDLL
ncbi:CocE/NonD family hydrolase [Streptomyces aurantiacus]|uniref:Putative Cocaine esterase n=1 Tax=Streptomyces aurantiacus JA 4570 TaxID=1286094 RepID=S3ZJ78_9ACTN|nr:CocE/NonD family hydrolase [Streptomyces aurantiacus]EPH43243.1 putative Cocaine esterase [Streptomyces aurantiacus JA 4570]